MHALGCTGLSSIVVYLAARHAGARSVAFLGDPYSLFGRYDFLRIES